MLIHQFSHNQDIENVKITLEEAFQRLDMQFTETEEVDNFIGFTHPDHEHVFIQFIRHDALIWTIDIPVFQDNEYINSLSGKIDHNTVFSIVMEFFNEDSFFQKNFITQNYQKIIDDCKNRWGLIMDSVNTESNSL